MDACPRCAPRPAQPVRAAAPESIPVAASAPAAPAPAPEPVLASAPAPLPYQTPLTTQQVPSVGYAYPEPAPKAPVNPVLVVVAVAAGLLGAGYLAFHFLPSSKLDEATTSGRSEKTKMVDATGANVNPLSKHIEVTGFRIREDKNQRVTVQMVIVNHGAADIAGLEMQVGLYAKGDLVVEFPVKVKNLGPFEVAQGTGQATTKLRAYEFPDWQFLTPKVTITAP